MVTFPDVVTGPAEQYSNPSVKPVLGTMLIMLTPIFRPPQYWALMPLPVVLAAGNGKPAIDTFPLSVPSHDSVRRHVTNTSRPIFTHLPICAEYTCPDPPPLAVSVGVQSTSR